MFWEILFNLEIKTQDISYEGTVLCVLRVESLKEEIEIEIRSPEIKSLRKFENKLCNFGLFLSFAISTYWVRYKKSEHDYIENVIDIELRNTKKIGCVEEAVKSESHFDWH